VDNSMARLPQPGLQDRGGSWMCGLQHIHLQQTPSWFAPRQQKSGMCRLSAAFHRHVPKARVCRHRGFQVPLVLVSFAPGNDVAVLLKKTCCADEICVPQVEKKEDIGNSTYTNTPHG
jgi:hypothetical protein